MGYGTSVVSTAFCSVSQLLHSLDHLSRHLDPSTLMHSLDHVSCLFISSQLLQSLDHVSSLGTFLSEADTAAASSSLPASLGITVESVRQSCLLFNKWLNSKSLQVR